MDRREAGRELAVALKSEGFDREEPLVVALPRGGVPVAFEVAKALFAPLDVLLVRKLAAPFNPEYGIGAIAEDGVRFIRRGEVELVGITDSELDEVVARESAELERRRRLYRGGEEPYPVENRTVILVDDGIATGGTAIAAGQALKARGAAKVILAVPVAPPGAGERLAGDFDRIVCLEQPHGFFGIGQFYVDFGQVDDDEVVRLLEEARLRAQAAAVGDPPPEPHSPPAERSVEIEAAPGALVAGDLRLPESPSGLVIFAHGSGSSRLSPRNRMVADALNEAGFATLLFDLLTPEEELDRARVFDIPLLSERLLAVTRWAEGGEELRMLPISYFGASTGAAAALSAAARLGGEIRAVVSRGGRPDLAGESLEDVASPTLLIVGGADWQVLELNEQAARLLRCEHEVAIVPGATHLFEEPGTLERVADLAASWFARHSARG
ncbi:MAG TPA: phosphoribosyltransferase family protein [Solirubrobacterales bacterium]